MDVAGKVYIIVSISSVYILFQVIIITLLRLPDRSPMDSEEAIRQEIWNIRTHQILVAFITLVAAALQTWMFRTLAYPRGINMAVALILFNLSVLLVFSGQFRIARLRNHHDNWLTTANPMRLSPVFAVLISIMYLAVSLAQSVTA